MKAYHFLRTDYRAGYGDEPPWQVGEERTWEGEVELCQSGYHSSLSWYDALLHAQGLVACLVEISKPVDSDGRKQVSKRRRLMTAEDATNEVFLWAADCCERALALDGQADIRSRAVLSAIRAYTRGKLTRKKIVRIYRDARAAAAWNTAADPRVARATFWAAEAVAETDAFWAASAAVQAASWAASATAWTVQAACEDALTVEADSWAAEATAAEAAEVEWQREALAQRLDALFGAEGAEGEEENV